MRRKSVRTICDMSTTQDIGPIIAHQIQTYLLCLQYSFNHISKKDELGNFMFPYICLSHCLRAPRRYTIRICGWHRKTSGCLNPGNKQKYTNIILNIFHILQKFLAIFHLCSFAIVTSVQRAPIHAMKGLQRPSLGQNQFGPFATIVKISW